MSIHMIDGAVACTEVPRCAAGKSLRDIGLGMRKRVGNR